MLLKRLDRYARYIDKLRIFGLATFLVCGISTFSAYADPISDAEDVPATAAEMQYINHVMDQVKQSVPPLEGWNRKLRVTVSGNSMREGEPVLIFERARNFPLKLILDFRFSKITDVQKKRAVAKRDTAVLEQEMMAAIQRQDLETVAEVQQKLMALAHGQMAEQTQLMAQAMNQPSGASAQGTAKKTAKFYVQVLINGAGEKIGKAYDMPSPPGVVHAFRIDKKNSGPLGYKYYLGGWAVSELNKKNWRIVFPKEIQTPDNHLRSLVVFAHVDGDRESVEKYVTSSLNLKGLESVLD
ncbi:hypothetical protein [Geopsychrobacter electrodiphilus]|uniref:hypothetical protein n=1 Tax=Geopsychrobacter electrodiphilus TaxID=225196 RepID=UPI00036E90D5|nr:hypothetical protein [Geopsychrobacter electrodiphilus]